MSPMGPIRSTPTLGPTPPPNPNPNPTPTLGPTLGLALTLALAAGARAQPPPAQAGLVVRFGDGRVLTRCVDLPEGGLTGLELLQRSGLDLKFQVQGLGALVCRIDQEGCPSENDCLCQCHSMGAGCRYWAYHSLRGDGWHYEQVGPTARRVGAGDVDGWAWGAGSVSDGVAPPPVTFAQVCAAAPPTALPSATDAPPTSAVPTVTAIRRATATAVPGALRSRGAGVTASPASGATRGATPTATAPPAGSAAPSRTPAGSAADPTAEALALQARRATLAAYPTALAALEATAAARAAGETPADGAPPVDDGAGGGAAVSELVPPDQPSMHLAPAAEVASPLAPSVAAPADDSPGAPSGRTRGSTWLALGVLAVLGLAWWRGRRAGA